MSTYRTVQDASKYAKAMGAIQGGNLEIANAAITVRNSQTSPLLRLPAELQIMVYEYALGGHYIVIRGSSKKYCLPGLLRQFMNNLFTSWKRSPLPLAIRKSERWTHVKELLGLGQTCRQTHSETGSMILSLNAFPSNQPLTRFTPAQCLTIKSLWVNTGLLHHASAVLSSLRLNLSPTELPALRRVVFVGKLAGEALLAKHIAKTYVSRIRAGKRGCVFMEWSRESEESRWVGSCKFPGLEGVVASH